MEEHKKAAADPPASAEKAERDSARLTSSDKVEVCCREHAGKEVELFCETCGEPVCVKCAIDISRVASITAMILIHKIVYEFQ